MKFALVFIAVLSCTGLSAQPAWKPVPTTWCNPMNLDYAYIPSRHTYYGRDESHRSTADPVIVNLRDTLYLFSTNQFGYWWTADNMASWNFVRQPFRTNRSNDNVCAPGAWAWGDSMLFMPSHMDSDRMPIYLSTNPAANQWTELVDSFPQKHAWDPSFFRDDDGTAYLYWGSSNTLPLYGVQLNPKANFTPIGPAKELWLLHPAQHGWERFGENHTDSTIAPYMEGAWMTKHNGKYYLQYAAPGTEFNVYADGTYVGDHPLGPFTYQAYNPISYKPGGFMTGAGHGSTFQDGYGNYWHVGTGLNWIKYKFERRLGVYPAGFDDDGQMYTLTSFGDYPHYLPTGPRDHRQSHFTGWMMLSYNKRTWASSSLPDKGPERAADENIRTYWSAATANPGEWLAMDLGAEKTIYALQINYADEDAHVYDKRDDIFHQYRIYKSNDGERWELAIDKSQNTTDVPHDYLELTQPIRARYLKIENVHMAAGKFALAGFRVFGKADGDAPAQVQGFSAERHADTRNVSFRWEPVPGAYAYQIHYGIGKKKLFTSVLVHGQTGWGGRGLNVGVNYFARVEALTETGVGKRSRLVRF